MVQPKDAPISFRPGDERLARIETWAKERKLSRHLAILTLIDAGLRGVSAPAEPVKPPPPPKPKLGKTARKIVAGLEEVAEIVEGKAEPARVFAPADIDVRAVRKCVGLSQDAFAARFGFSAATVRQWEQGRRRPEAAARVLLRVIEREPEAVERALAEATPRPAVLRKPAPPPKPKPVPKVEKVAAVHVDVPWAGNVKRGAYQKTGKR